MEAIEKQVFNNCIEFDGVEIHYNFSDYVFNFEVASSSYNDETELSGFIKWDGCSHFYFNDGLLHLDDMAGIEEHCRLIKRIYVLAAETIPNWQGD